MKKKRLSAIKSKTERKMIEKFYLSRVSTGMPHHYVFTSDLFKVYKEWRGGKTPLSVDGFGRMLPKHLEKKSVFSDKGTRRAVFGVRLK